MGRDKALLAYRGRTFLEHIVATLRQAGIERVAVVLGHHAEEIRKVVDQSGMEVVINTDYRRGQTSSLQAGIQTLDRAGLEAVVLCLVDHPAVSANVIRRLITSFQESRAPVVIPAHRGRNGHPVIIAKALFEELKGLGPSEGANTVIRKYREATQWLAVEDPGVLLDVDDPETYARVTGVIPGRRA